MYTRFFLQLNQFPKLIMLAALLISFFFFDQVRQKLFDQSSGELIIDSTVEPFIERSSGAYQEFLEVRDAFGNEDVLVVALHQPKTGVGLDFINTLADISHEVRKNIPESSPSPACSTSHGLQEPVPENHTSIPSSPVRSVSLFWNAIAMQGSASWMVLLQELKMVHKVKAWPSILAREKKNLKRSWTHFHKMNLTRTWMKNRRDRKQSLSSGNRKDLKPLTPKSYHPK